MKTMSLKDARMSSLRDKIEAKEEVKPKEVKKKVKPAKLGGRKGRK